MSSANYPHWGGPISTILSEHKNADHGELVYQFAKYFGERSAAFQLQRFVVQCGGSKEEAERVATRIWQEMSDERKKRLYQSARFTRSAWFWEVENAKEGFWEVENGPK
jgi:hypothetical protein